MFIETGNYQVLFYDKYGHKLKQFEGGATTSMTAMAVGRDMVQGDKEINSFTIDRRIFNSLDKE